MKQLDKFDDESRTILCKHRLHDNWGVSRQKEMFSCIKAVYYGNREFDTAESGVGSKDYRVAAKYWRANGEKDSIT